MVHYIYFSLSTTWYVRNLYIISISISFYVLTGTCTLSASFINWHKIFIIFTITHINFVHLHRFWAVKGKIILKKFFKSSPPVSTASSSCHQQHKFVQKMFLWKMLCYSSRGWNNNSKWWHRQALFASIANRK